MMTSRLPLLAALLLAGGLSACGNKDKAAEQTTAATLPTAGSGTPTPVPAAGVAATTPAATPATDATFDLSSVPVSTANMGSFPYLAKLPGYHLNVPSDSTDYEFDRLYVYDGKQMLPVEGHVLRRQYVSINQQKETSELMMERNYENLVKTLGGVKVWSGEIPGEARDKVGDDYSKYHGLDAGKSADTYLIRQKDKEVWVQLVPDHYSYTLNVVERAAMPQKLTVTPAAELKKN
ncbi:hypothetical protein [Hymenobacter psoromatis]|uniref:hypothetical protein n=1 Tax=Hymenobacter psoromatis TaxID=1484116 RepID=UPI001CC16CB0|nr:hypothetical protein [Hymenobacter psoromatis]